MFNGKDEDFPAFREQFEAKMHIQGLSKCLENKLVVPAEVNGESEEATAARVLAETERERQQYMVWCDLVQCLDKSSINFIRPFKPNGCGAWAALVKRFVSSERPRVQTMLTQLTSLKMGNESMAAYITRAEGLKLDVTEAGEAVSDIMFQSMVLKGLPKQFKTVQTVLLLADGKSWD